MKIAIIGYGKVGQAMHQLFTQAIIYDKPKNIGSFDEVNQCDTAFICVPTPMAENGECDTSIVEEVIAQCDCPLLILRSTISVGFTRKMAGKYQKTLFFSPNIMAKQWLTLLPICLTELGCRLVVKEKRLIWRLKLIKRWSMPMCEFIKPVAMKWKWQNIWKTHFWQPK